MDKTLKGIYYNARHDLMGFTFGLPDLIKISETNEFMVLTKDWILICEL